MVGPWGLLQSFADLLKFVLKEPVIPAGANKGVFLLAPLVTCVLALAAWAVIPVDDGWVIADINVGILYIFAISSLGVYGIIMARLGVELEISVPGGAALGRADGVLRGLDRLRHHHRAAVRRLAQSVGDRRGAGRQIRHVQLVLAAAVADVRGLLHLGAGGDQPAAVRSGRKRNPSSSPASWSNTARRRTCCSCSASTSRSSPCARWRTILFLGGWLPPFPIAPFTWVPGVIWFMLKCLFMFFLFAMVKAIVPRYRYDQLMRLGWKVFLPISLAMVAIVAGVLQFTGLAPDDGVAMLDIRCGLIGALSAWSRA